MFYNAKRGSLCSYYRPCTKFFNFISVGDLQTINPIKITTVTNRAFCSTECVDFSGCNSFAYLTAMNTDNCQLSASVDGESTTAVSVVYKKVPAKSSVSAVYIETWSNSVKILDKCGAPEQEDAAFLKRLSVFY